MRIGMRLLLGYFLIGRDRRVVCAVDLCQGSEAGRAPGDRGDPQSIPLPCWRRWRVRICWRQTQQQGRLAQAFHQLQPAAAQRQYWRH